MEIRRHYKPEVVASKDKTRTNLRDPFLDVANEALVATNGHCLVAVPVDVEDLDVSGYVARDFLKVARRKAPKDAHLVQIENRTVLKPADIEWPIDEEHVGDKFPDWRPLVPNHRGKKVLTIGLNAALLKKVADALGCDGIVALTVDTEALEGPIVVRALAGDLKEVGLLMPCRVDSLGKVEEDPVVELPPTEEERKAAERVELERQADEKLAATGDGELNRKDLKGDAVTRKGTRRA